jgi:sugar phosphate isomerase/epimerase
MLAAGTGSLLGLAAFADPKTASQRARMGVVIHSFAIRRSADKERRLDDPAVFLEHCRALGAGGIQTSLGVRNAKEAARLRAQAEAAGMYLEGSVALPRDRAGVERFTAEVETARQCGATVSRTVLMAGRRYEAFDRAEAFREFAARGRQSLELARPVVEKHQLRLAVENHKDLQAPELVEVIRKMDSAFVGTCIDTGNNIALLEAPQETVDLLAPLAFTSHIKDMGVQEYADGFLLSEVPLGTGFLDLAKIVETLRRAQPRIRLNLEMITRDPLQVPCLTRKYWATLEHVPGRRLAEMIALVRANAAKKPLPRISSLSKDEAMQREEENVRQSLEHARKRLDA